ncbi:MAG: hypothetical protein V7691_10610 [Galbibacter orientalis]|uniref:hypothetical protein n=1 Tax=Galbibacter orientalis TaxID=453852 RepID=UPI0030038C31
MKKKYIKIIFLVVAVLATLIIVANLLITNFIEKKIAQNNSDYSFEITDVNTNILTRTVTFKNVIIHSKSKDSASIKKIEISGISINNLFSKNNFEIEKIYVENGDGYLSKKNSAKKNNEQKNFKIKIKEIEVKNTNLSYNTAVEKEPIKVENIGVILNEVIINTNHTVKQVFKYQKILLTAENIELSINNHLNFKIGKIKADKQYIKASNVGIKTLYSKKELQKHVTVQTDWINLDIDSILIDKYQHNTYRDSALYEANNLKIYNGNIEIYKNKLLPEPTKYKPLYSKALRNLPFKLNINHLEIINSRIKYAERVKNYEEPGNIVFTEVNSTIENINSMEGNGETKIEINSKFMDNADFKLLWNFDINNKADFFTLHGNMKNLSAHQINDFVEPNMNVETSGEIKSIVFNVNANENVANGSFELKYDDFKITIKKKNKNVVNKFFTNVANLFMKNDKNDNKKVEIKVERDKQKSFFNYFWLCVREGTLQTVL